MILNYLLSRLCLVDSREGRKYKLELFDIQKDILQSVRKREANLIYTTRCQGVSTILAILAIAYAIEHDRERIILVQHNDWCIRSLIQVNMELFDGVILPRVVIENRRIKFSNGTSIILARHRDILRGYSLDCVFIDNYDEYCHRELSMAIIPTVCARTGTLIMSTSGMVTNYSSFNEIFGDQFWGTRRVLTECLIPR